LQKLKGEGKKKRRKKKKRKEKKRANISHHGSWDPGNPKVLTLANHFVGDVG
jgi:hypothetical protein